jgi:LPXTG-motif cell wall-anchored protein
MKRLLSFILIIAIVFCLTGICFAHEGRTDKYGGHFEKVKAGFGPQSNEYILNYHYHSGEYKGEVFIFWPDEKILWKNRYKFLKENGPFIPETETTTTTPTTTPTTTETTTTTPETITPTPTGHNNIDEELPKTGENDSTIYLLIGSLLLITGSAYVFFRLFKPKKM